MSATINTPLIETVLQNPAYQVKPSDGNKFARPVVDSRDYTRYISAVADLLKGLEEGKIFNVVLNDAKFHLSRCLDHALEPVCDNWGEVARLRGNHSIPDHISEAWSLVSHYGSFNQFRGRITRLEKWIKTYTSPKYDFLMVSEELLQATKDVLDFYREAAQFQVVLDALKPMIVKGRRPAENPVETDLTNTGECSICGKRHKLYNDKLVDHGFTISNGGGSYFGYRRGPCFGVGYPAYELSYAGNEAYAPVLKQREEATIAYLNQLQKGEIKSLIRMETRRVEGSWKMETYPVTYSEGTAEFDHRLKAEISSTQNGLEWLKVSIENNQAMIDNWKLQPLKYGRKE